MLKEFKAFALKGNMLDMAVGIVIGVAFATVVSSLVNHLLMPPLGLALGGVDFADLFVVLREGEAAGPYATLAAAEAAGAVTIAYGQFVNALIAFLLVALALFFVIRSFNRLQKEQEQAEPAPEPAPSDEARLLAEIRDLLRGGAPAAVGTRRADATGASADGS